MTDYKEPQVKIYSFEELLSEKGYIVYTNVGTSMLPLLRERRDIIDIRPLDAPPRKYGVLLYKRGSTYILHRVIKVLPGGKGYWIAGDHNVFIERDVTDRMILGRMTRIIRDGREIKVDEDLRYKLYSRVWVDFFPVKCLILRVKGKAARVYHRMKKSPVK
ncbi:MAG: hypothetical protein J6D53_00055 [Blautia sp.]|nr:hypothetical protein [Blautia sp.]